MKTILHTCSSVLVRPNGIVRYINAVIDLQKSLGHHVLFATDAAPSQAIHADRIIYAGAASTYQLQFKDDHVWLHNDTDISRQIRSAFDLADISPDLIVAHDLMSYNAFSDLDNGIFIQHESDVMNTPDRHSLISDRYLEQQLAIVNGTPSWRMGLPVDSTAISPIRAVATPVPFCVDTNTLLIRDRGLLYIGDASERKGAPQFMALARRLGVTPTVITHETNAALFENADVYSFSLDQREEMLALMARHRVAYIPSKNECFSLAVLECLQYMPTVLDGAYRWAHHVRSLGATVVTGDEIDQAVQHYLTTDVAYDTQLIKIWAHNSQQCWHNLSV